MRVFKRKPNVLAIAAFLAAIGAAGYQAVIAEKSRKEEAPSCRVNGDPTFEVPGNPYVQMHVTCTRPSSKWWADESWVETRNTSYLVEPRGLR